MKYNRLHTAFLIVSLAFIGLMVDSCKSKKQEIPPFIDVHLEVKDANNVPSTGATVYLYNTEEAFQEAYQNSLNLKYNSTGSILTTTISDGKLDLKGLPSNTEYWVLVHDTSSSFIDGNGKIIDGYKIDKDNSEAYYKIDGFQNGTTVLANITLQPVSSLVQLNNVSGGGFVKLELNSKDGTLGYNKVRKGDIPYFARTDQCVWTGAIDAEGGKVVTEDLVKCSSRQLTFTHAFTPAETSAGMEIKVFLGQNRNNLDPKPLVLTAKKSSQSIILAIDGLAYSYFAESITGSVRNCVYEDIISDGTTSVTVNLVSCN